jgi:hypothetical protein
VETTSTSYPPFSLINGVDLGKKNPTYYSALVASTTSFAAFTTTAPSLPIT